MNKQGKRVLIDGKFKVIGGIDWLISRDSDGNERCGYTSNIFRGCFHDCQWKIAGKIAICYAKDVAEGIAKSAYPQGFAYSYIDMAELNNWARVKEPSRVFAGSMADVFGTWNEDKEIKVVLDACNEVYWHTYLFLTKNAPRLLKFKYPNNVHVGVSTPPDFFMGKELVEHQKEAMLRTALSTFGKLPDRTVTFLSAEPLSFDIAPILNEFPDALSWIIIGAASRGREHFQPNPEHVNRVLDVADANNIPVFMKNGMEWDVIRKEYPE